MKLKYFFGLFLAAFLIVLAFALYHQVDQRVRVREEIPYAISQGFKGKKQLHLDLYLPPQQRKTFPLIIYIHGGGWMSGSKKECPGQEVASQGYAMACVDYRLSGEAPFPAQIYDVKAAVRWLRANAREYNLNPEKFAAWGPSAGGHLSALLGTSGGVEELEGDLANEEVSSRVQAVANWFGPTDFTQVPPAFEVEKITEEVLNQHKDEPWFVYTYATTQLLAGSVSEKEKLARQANPLTYVDKDDPPMQILHGELDDVVPISQSEILAAELAAKGVEYELVRLPNWGHSYGPEAGEFKPELLELALEFFGKYLK